MTEVFHPARADRNPGVRAGRFLTVAILFFIILTLGNTLFAAVNMEYRVTESDLKVRYGLRVASIPLAEVEEVRVVEHPSGGVRLFGTGTTGLKTGRWRFAETGEIVLYASRLDRLVVLEGGEKRWGVTPADPEGLMAAIAGRTPGVFPPVRGVEGSLWRTLLPVAFVVVAIGATVWALGVSGRFPGGLRYEVGPNGITIRTGLRPIYIPYSDLKKVELDSPPGYPLRRFGVRAAGMLWGLFYWPAAGPNLRLYATQAKPLVLLHLHDGRTIGITPEEAGRFVAAVKPKL